jgi:dipicolinate synthase subunit A
MLHLSERLAEEGYPVSLLGCGDECLPRRSGMGEIHVCKTLSKATENATVLILPLPATRDQKTVACPRDPACTLPLAEIADLLDRNPAVTLFGGKLPASLTEGREGQVVDYYDDPILQLRNALVTAEAALMTAMELTDRTLRDTTVAVLGHGRIGKYLSRLLRNLGAQVTVCARRQESLFEAAAEGCRPLLITQAPDGGLAPLCRDHAVLFNTVPAPVLPREILLGLEPSTLLIDLASAPFGVGDEDVQEAAAQNGLRYLRAPSLPGSYAPRDAGRIIAECILNRLAEVKKGGEGS